MKSITIERLFFKEAPEGTVFYTEKLDRQITALSNHYNRRVTTQKILLVEPSPIEPTCKNLVKVTLGPMPNEIFTMLLKLAYGQRRGIKISGNKAFQQLQDYFKGTFPGLEFSDYIHMSYCKGSTSKFILRRILPKKLPTVTIIPAGSPHD